VKKWESLYSANVNPNHRTYLRTYIHTLNTYILSGTVVQTEASLGTKLSMRLPTFPVRSDRHTLPQKILVRVFLKTGSVGYPYHEKPIRNGDKSPHFVDLGIRLG
jgi:hypothetical protein